MQDFSNLNWDFAKHGCVKNTYSSCTTLDTQKSLCEYIFINSIYSMRIYNWKFMYTLRFQYNFTHIYNYVYLNTNTAFDTLKCIDKHGHRYISS